jgi:hypothetical protein
MAEIVGGLFGVSPEQLMRQRQATDASNAFRYAQLAPLEQAKMSIYQGSAGLGRGVQGLLGGDPELERISQIKQLSSQFDLTSADGARQFARALQPFAPQEAMMAAREAERMEQAGLTRQKTAGDIQRAEAVAARETLSVEQETKLRAALSALGPDATEQQIIGVVTQFGSPDKILQVLTQSQDRRARIAAAAAAGKTEAPPKPLSASLQKSEDKDIEAIDTYLAQGEALKPSILNLTPDAKGVRTLELGPARNAKYIAQNALGNSTPESRAYEALKSAVDTAVNLQVSAEKGVQTDKDVLRFANALIAAYGRNDTNATLEALKRYNDSLERAKTRTEARVDQRRVSQKVEPLFGGQQRPAPTQPEKPTTAKTRTLKSGVVVTIED